MFFSWHASIHSCAWWLNRWVQRGPDAVDSAYGCTLMEQLSWWSFLWKISAKYGGKKGTKNSQAKCALPCPIYDLKELECVIIWASQPSASLLSPPLVMCWWPSRVNSVSLMSVVPRTRLRRVIWLTQVEYFQGQIPHPELRAALPVLNLLNIEL